MVGGGSPAASQVRVTLPPNVTVTLPTSSPSMLGGTEKNTMRHFLFHEIDHLNNIRNLHKYVKSHSYSGHSAVIHR